MFMIMVYLVEQIVSNIEQTFGQTQRRDYPAEHMTPSLHYCHYLAM